MSRRNEIPLAGEGLSNPPGGETVRTESGGEQ